MSLGDFTLVQERSLPVFLLVDTSSSMNHENRIGRVNDAISDMLADLRKDMPNAQDNLVVYKMGIIAFGGGKVTLQPLQDVREMQFKPLHAAGDTPLKEALDVLLTQIQQLDRREYAPCVVLLSDGKPWIKEDPHYFEKVTRKLKDLQQEKRIAKSQFFAVKLGEVRPEQTQFLLDFVRNKTENYIDAKEVNQIKKAFEYITLSVTQQAATIVESFPEDESVRVR